MDIILNSGSILVIMAAVVGLFMAWGIGANDVANAMGTSVGSKALTIKQAVILASVFETSGAILMGSHVTKTIRKGIADYECFQDDPGALMYGSMCVCLSVGMWLFLASKYEMPVSTTHSCVGGMIGMTLVLKGSECVIWYEEKDSFPYVGGVIGIVASWVVSPVFSALISSGVFAFIRAFVLRSENSYNRTTILFPILIGSVTTINSFFIIYKGAKGLGLNDTSFDTACIWSFGIGAVAAIMIIPFTNIIKNKIDERLGVAFDMDTISDGGESIDLHFNDSVNKDSAKENSETSIVCCGALQRHLSENLNADIDQIVKNNEEVSAIHGDAEKFDPKTEEYFKSLQVFTAICGSFSHGANDVANAIGPFAAIYMIGRDDVVQKNNELGDDGYWILGMGGIGITLGLLLYGYKIIHAIGLKLCKITPSRGVAIELASAMVIIAGSRLEIPLSTTHCQVGATVGVAALEDTKNLKGVNWVIVGRTVVGWGLTLVVVGSTTAILTAQGTYAPEVGRYDCNS